MWKLISILACVLQASILINCDDAPKGFYSILAPGTIRSNSEYDVAVSVHGENSAKIKVGILSDKYKDEKTVDVTPDKVEIVKFKVPELEEGDYNVTAEGLSGIVFKNTTKLTVERKYYSVYIQTDKATYKPGDLVRFRVLILDANTRPLNLDKKTVDIAITDSAQNLIKQFKKIELTKGVYSGEIQLSPFPVLGNWKIDVAVDDKSTSKGFEVAKYVLPKFDVKVDTPKDVAIADNKIVAIIRSQYTYGKPVKGKAVVTIKPAYNYYNNKPTTVEKTIPVDGKGKVEFSLTEDLKFDVKDANFYSPPMEIFAIVEEELTGLKQNSTAQVRLHKDRFSITPLPKNPYQYVPGEAVTIGFSITSFDGKPVIDAKNPVILEIDEPHYYHPIPIRTDGANEEPKEIEKKEPKKLETKLDENGIATFEFTIPSSENITYYQLKVKYLDQSSYIGSISKKEPKIGDQFEVEILTEKPTLESEVIAKVSSNQEIPYFVYQIVGRGNTLISEKVVVPEKKTEHEIKIKPTFEMIPKANLLVYYVDKDGNLIFAETGINFESKLENYVKINIPTEAKPGDDIDIKVSSNPDSYVGLMGVDQSVLLLKSGNDITKDNVFGEISQYDTRTPWIPGYGRYPGQQSGLVTLTNAHFPYDQSYLPYDGLLVNLESASFAAGFHPAMAASAGGGALGGSVAPIQSISVRSEFPETWLWTEERPTYPHYITSTYAPQASQPTYLTTKLPKFEPSRIDVTDRPVTVRKEFPETWIWLSESYENGEGEFTIHNKVPDTITSWVLTGFSVNPKYGLGLTQTPKNLKVFQPFFVSTNLPYSVKRGEVISIPIVVFNYMENDLETEITMDNTDKEYEFTEATNEVEEKAIDEVKRTKRLSIPSNSGKSVSFMISPKHVGHIKIKVTAQTPVSGDAVEQMLLVEPEGVTQYVNKAMLINLNKDKPEQNEKVDIDIPENVVPDSEYVQINVVGDLMGPTIKNLDKLIRMPYGCGEQNMVNFVPNILVLKYLNNIQRLNPSIENRAKKFLEVGYQRELTYKHDDGSYSAFGKQDGNGSTWLTAYVVKSFHQAIPYTDIDTKIITEGLSFLAMVQAENGSFPEYGKVIDKAHSGESESGIALTAYVLLAFLENTEYRSKYEDTIQKGLKFLSANIDKEEDPYAIAITALALQLAKDEKAEKVLSKLNSVAKTESERKWWAKEEKKDEKKENLFYWHQPKSADVEMTAYALLATLEDPKTSASDTLPIIRWLISKRNSNGGFSSTQDTVVGLQALIKFSEKYSAGGQSGNVNIEFSDDKGTKDKITVDKENALVLQTHVLPPNAKTVDIKATGEGSSLVQVSYKYNTVDKTKVKRFIIEPKVKETPNKDQLKLDVCFRYVPIDDDKESNMAVLEVNLPSGYTTSENDGTLDELINTANVKRVETKNKETTVVVYYDKVDEKDICAPIEATKTSAVAKQKPVAIQAYDYYNTGNQGIEYYEVVSSLCDICDGDDCGKGCTNKTENP